MAFSFIPLFTTLLFLTLVAGAPANMTLITRDADLPAGLPDFEFTCAETEGLLDKSIGLCCYDQDYPDIWCEYSGGGDYGVYSCTQGDWTHGNSLHAWCCDPDWCIFGSGTPFGPCLAPECYMLF
ncbi:MAG: hypothetical protein M1834_002640 [Cirrosporium novae-zelandiae]|nr:MAG: hypothetical protein M1834_002640 [Cirrosporium novae-zelandiae]